MSLVLDRAFVTPAAWPPPSHGRDYYGSRRTYHLAAEWLKDCASVADWGGATGFFGTFLSPSVSYTVVDGTKQCDDVVLVDLSQYRVPSDGILLRHVLDNCDDWRSILRNALVAFRQRMVVVTYTPAAPLTILAKHKGAWPIWHFNPADLIAEMGPFLVQHDDVQTSHPEHVFYLERQ